MKTVNSKSELIVQIESDNYYFRGNHFSDYEHLQNAAEEYFNNVTAEYEDLDGYYNRFGVAPGKCAFDQVRTECYFDEESNCTLTVHFVEAYIDPGVPDNDYFHAFFITD